MNNDPEQLLVVLVPAGVAIAAIAAFVGWVKWRSRDASVTPASERRPTDGGKLDEP